MKARSPQYNHAFEVASGDELSEQEIDYISHTLAQWIHNYSLQKKRLQIQMTPKPHTQMTKRNR